MPEFKQTDPLLRAWLQNRIQGFLPRIKKLKKTKAADYAFTAGELLLDLRRTADELGERVEKLNKTV